MARVPRNRSRSDTLSGTRSILQNGAVIGTPTTISRINACSCSDFVGRPVLDGTFSSLQRTGTLDFSGDVIGKPISGVRNGLRYNKVPAAVTVTGTTTSALPAPGGWFADLVARTNPSRPTLTPATLIQDFVELPSMVLHIGSLLKNPKRIVSAKDAANHNLAVQFGWMPLVEDLNTLLNLQRAVLKRQNELQRLYSGKGLRRRITFGEDHQSAAFESRTTIAAGQYFDSGHDIDVKRKLWATIRWKPTTSPGYSPSNLELNRLATKLTLGLTSEGLVQGVWDVIPWTWLLDWFTNVGSLLMQNSNTVPATHSSGCLMSEVIVVLTPTPTKYSTGIESYTLERGTPYRFTQKSRAVSSSASLGFSMPFIGIKRLSILGSLFVQRFLR